MSSRLTGLTPMLETPDLAGTAAFYESVLGFERRGYVEGVWLSVERDGVEIMFAAPNQHRAFDGPVFSGSLYLRSADIDLAWEELRDKARVAYEIESFDYGMREFAIYDNNGYMLQFGQPAGETIPSDG